MSSFLILLGTTRLYLFSDFFLIYQLTVLRLFRPVQLNHPSKWLFGLIIVLALSATLSPITTAQMWQTLIRIIVLSYVLPNYKVKHTRASYLFLVIILAVMLWQILFVETRAHGHHLNATVFGMFGMVLVFSVPPLGIAFLSASIARIPLIVLWIYTVLDRKKRTIIITVMATAVFIIVGLIQTPERLTTTGTREAIELRHEAITGFSETYLDDNYNDGRCGERNEAHFSILGYGYGGFCYRTGQPTPHNSYLLSFYELGILAIPFWICLFMLIRNLPYKAWIPLAFLAFFTDDLLATPEGIYVIGLWLMSIGIFKFQYLQMPSFWYGYTRK